MNRLNLGRDLYIKGRIGWRGLNKDEYLEKSEYKIINATALMDGYVDWNNCGYISKERYEESEEIMLKEGDILISKDGTLGKIGYVKNLKGYCTVASGIFVLRNIISDILDFDYLYHVLKSNIFKDFINRNKALGSTINHLYQRDLENFELDLPSIEKQHKIAKVLNDLDEKIDKNNKINDNLEELAFSMFLFNFGNKKDNGTIGNIVKENSKSSVKVGEAKDIKGDFPFFTSGESILEWNDYLVDGRNLYLNTGGNADVKFYVGKAMYSTDTWCITTINNYSDYLYLYFKSIKSALDKKFFHGSGLKHLQKPLLKNEKIYIPNNEEIRKFNEKVQPMFDTISANENENKRLNSLKEFLLPLLMNGQINVDDIDI